MGINSGDIVMLFRSNNDAESEKYPVVIIDDDKLEDFIKRKSANIAYDKDNNPVFLAPSPFLLTQAESDYPEIIFHKTSEFKLDE